MNLDKMKVREAIALILQEEAGVAAKLLRVRTQLERMIGLAVRSFQKGGRLFYVGAGTSGRLGVLDASECPPTFGVSPNLVQGIIAGGRRALSSSVEGVEDDGRSGTAEIRRHEIGKQDIVLGIAASGTTPFVRRALLEAKKRGAATVLLCFNPHVHVPRRERPTMLIAPDLGPEVLTGSTRLKCGTATKLVLNMLTTLAMVQMGHVISNLMVNLKPTNNKLRHRAVRVVRALTGYSDDTARRALEQNGWIIRKAIARRDWPRKIRPRRTFPGDKKW